MSIQHYSSDDPTSFQHEGAVEQPGDWSVGRVFKSKQKSDGKVSCTVPPTCGISKVLNPELGGPGQRSAD
jgi:hypothetical protein